MLETCSVDTSPLLYLFRVGKLDLIRALFNHVLVAEGVVAELKAGQTEGAWVPELSNYPWIEYCQTTTQQPPKSLANIDSGERDTILLVLSGQAQWAILDDLKARLVAVESGVQVIGTVGILSMAKKKGIIASVGPVLKELVTAGMWLSQSLINDVLDLAGER